MGDKVFDFCVGDRVFKVATDAADALLGYTLKNERTWEPWQLELYRRLLKPDAVCYDIGGNVGTSSLAMSKYAPNGHVFAFEPVKNTLRILNDNIKRNGISNIETVAVGLSNVEGEASIIVDRAMLGNAHQVKDYHKLASTQYVETMQLMPLDTWRRVNSKPRPDLIKIDVEGFEIEVFEGGEETFNDPSLLVIVEFAIIPQRTSGNSYFPEIPKDALFFDMLQKKFRHVFLIGRDAKLFPVKSYAELRVLMMRGYPVDDLLCCQAIPSAVADLISVPEMPKWLTTGAILVGDSLFSTLNRDDDGWAMKLGSELSGVSGIIAHVSHPTMLTIDLAPLKYENIDVGLRPVMVASENGVKFAAEGESVPIPLHTGVNWILLEAQHDFSASRYFGNPSDHRRISFGYTLRTG